MKLLILTYSFLFFGCVTSSQIKPIEFFHDMNLEANMKKGKGFLIVDPYHQYKIKANWDYRVSSLISISNCHRDMAIKPSTGLFKKGDKEIELLFVPTSIEQNEHCPLFIGAFDKDGRHSFGAIFFRNQDETITSKLECNGVTSTNLGLSVCQSKANSVVRIAFAETNLEVAGEENCPEMEKTAPNVFEYNSSVGECLYTFSNDGKKFHKHVSFGYNKFALRED